MVIEYPMSKTEGMSAILTLSGKEEDGPTNGENNWTA